MTKSHYSYKEFLPLRVPHENLHAYTLCIICSCKKNVKKNPLRNTAGSIKFTKETTEKNGNGLTLQTIIVQDIKYETVLKVRL